MTSTSTAETVLTCMLDGYSHRFQLLRTLGNIACGTRYEARDVSNRFPEPGQPPPRLVSFELIQPIDDAHRQRLAAAFGLFRHRPSPFLLELIGAGEVLEAEYAGMILLVTEPWDITLEERLAGTGTLPDDELDLLFECIAGGLFCLHETGWAHGAVGSSAIVRTPDRIWKLAPSQPLRGAQTDPSRDIVAAGRVLERAVCGVTSESLEANSHEKPAVGRASGAWSRLKSGLNVRKKGRTSFGRRSLLELFSNFVGDLFRAAIDPRKTTTPAPIRNHTPRVPAIPSGWQTVLDGCLHPEPSRRWGAARLLFGQNDPPAVRELTAERIGPTVFQVSWTAPDRGEVRLFSPGDGRLPACNEVSSLNSLDELGPRVVGDRVTLPPQRENLRLVAVTVINELNVMVYGGTVTLTLLPEVSDVHGIPGRGMLHLTWNWPENIHLAYVAVRPDRYAAADEGAFRFECIRGNYEKLGRFDVPLREDGIDRWLYVTVFASQRQDGQLQFSPGAAPGTRWEGPAGFRTLRYGIESPNKGWLFWRRRLPSGPYRLILRPNRPIVLPELVLKSGTDGAPVHRDEGFILTTVPAGARCSPEQPFVIEFVRPAFRGRCHAALFCQRVEDYNWLLLETATVADIYLD